MLDTVGSYDQEIRSEQLKEADGFLLVYSITSNSTLEDLNLYRDEIVRCKGSDDFPCIIVGNKIDLEGERVVSTEQGRHFANKYGSLFKEVSAKKGTNVVESFVDLVDEIMKRDPSLASEGLTMYKENQKKKEGKCVLC